MKTKLRKMREELGLTQEAMVRRTSLSFTAYRNAEKGKRVTYGTGMEILSAINAIRQEQEKTPVTLEELELTLY